MEKCKKNGFSPKNTVLWNFAMKHCNILKTSLCFLKVTVLYVERSPAIAEIFSFLLDPSLSNVTVYVTGDSPAFTLYSPTGEQKHLEHCVDTRVLFSAIQKSSCQNHC